MNDDDKKISKKVDRFIMGAILGGAIGSVIGMTMARKEGKETRKALVEKGKKLFQKGAKEKLKEEGEKIFNFIKGKIPGIRPREERSDILDKKEAPKIPHEK